MSFRPATTEDEEFFYYWRQRAEQAGSDGHWWQGVPTTPEAHHAWYVDRLARARLMVWIVEGRPAGAVRIDTNGEVDFGANAWLAPKLLQELKPFAEQYGGRLKVTTDYANRLAVKALKDAGYRESPVRFFTYKTAKGQ